ncbi:aminotransferase class V-fold PLP-dependent enzyme [Balneola vulgaris]|uniref:aminotransferase class V-fold PLP-dependent enzyme n=1 Tax=Balneola vulgaris TaxID=287535 RepID=UPI00036D1FF4|nr:aminotransferase class V-fold PLP-dependent enzyme [Balneola vulgaris]
MDCKKAEFDLDPNVTFLNCAYMSPLLNTVEEAGIQGIKRKRRPHIIPPTDFFDETDILRKEYAKLVHCSEPNRLVVIPSASYGMANVAKNVELKASDNIIVAGEQFPSNVYPWMEIANKAQATIKTIAPPNTLDGRGKAWNEQILEAIDEHTRLVAMGNIHWADGTIFDMKAIRAKTTKVGALMAIDGTQSIGAMPFNIDEIKPDALVTASYKSLMGPYSIGMAYYGPSLNHGSPIEQNWINRYESENFSNLVNYSDRYQDGALRYEVGEHSNFILVPMLIAAVKKLNEWGPENIQEYCRNLVEPSIQKLREAGYWIEETEYRASNLFGIRLGNQHDMEKIKAALTQANILVSYRGDAIRVSPSIYNDELDMAKLVSVLTSF